MPVLKRPGWSLTETLSTRPFNVVGNVASIAGLVVAVVSELNFKASAIPLAYVCALSLYLLVRYVRQERWARYAEGVQPMERAARRLAETIDRTVFESEGRQVYLDGLQSSLSAFAEAFTLVTGSDCRASIKELYTEDVMIQGRSGRGSTEVERGLFVATVVRSDRDTTRRVGEAGPDLVADNSDFQQILSTNRPFFGRNLPQQWKDRKYRNSHWTEERIALEGFPYASAIVWPVQVDPPIGSSRDEEDRVIAFLCVDSRRRSAFSRNADTNFGAVYAHALYPALRYHLGQEATA